MTYLLDVNVLLALIDTGHVFHEAAHRWFAREARQGWATCPITENGAIRIFGHQNYPSGPGTPAAALHFVKALAQHPQHSFWPDEVSLLSTPNATLDRISDPKHITDIYLLALAVRRGGRLATFDRRIAGAAVTGGVEALALLT